MRFALLSVVLSVTALSVGCAVEAEPSAAADDNEIVAHAGVTPGEFVLHAKPNHNADPKCDSFTDLSLKAGGRAELSDRLTGGCALVALYDPNPRAYTLRETQGSCGSKVFIGSRRVALGPATTGLATIKITDHRTRLCRDVVPAQIIVEETGVQSAIMYSQRSTSPAGSPPSPEFCANGTVESEPSFISSTNDMECSIPRLHCVTKDSNACPMLSPLPPDFCAGGRVVTEPSWIASADGMECSLPRVHCVTRDASACPQLSPPSPDFCKDGTIKTTPNFFPSADGDKECSIPSLHCVTSDKNACPMF